MPKRRDESTGAIVALPPKRVRGGKRKGGGAKLVRSETVTVRLDPKLRYLGEIAARKQRRTVSSFIEWAIEDVLRRVSIEEPASRKGESQVSLFDVQDKLWDTEEADRFAKLAFSYPELLTYDEQRLWKLVKEGKYFWRTQESRKPEDFRYTWFRVCWPDAKPIATGEASRDQFTTFASISLGDLDPNRFA
jgi:hypothetical protein